MSSPESPPDAPRPRHEGEDTEPVPCDENRSHSTPHRVTFGAHSRWACCARSFATDPCHKCCRCWSEDRCEHPAFAEWEAA
jgi:hypothetical protein